MGQIRVSRNRPKHAAVLIFKKDAKLREWATLFWSLFILKIILQNDLIFR